MSKDVFKNVRESYYNIFLVFKVSKDVLNEMEDENIVTARNILYDRLNSFISEQEYDVFSSNVVIYQLEDEYNYLITYNSFIRNLDKLPMDGYVAVRDIKDSIKDEFIKFFDSISLEYKLLNIKALV